MNNSTIKITKENNGMVTKAFAKKAQIFGTEEFKLWREFLEVFPKAKMVIKTPKKNSDRKTYLNMTYDNMKGYIAEQENAEDLMKEFEKNLALSKIQTNPYRFMVAWFEEKFKDYDDYKKYFAKQKVETQKVKLAVKKSA